MTDNLHQNQNTYMSKSQVVTTRMSCQQYCRKKDGLQEEAADISMKKQGENRCCQNYTQWTKMTTCEQDIINAAQDTLTYTNVYTPTDHYFSSLTKMSLRSSNVDGLCVLKLVFKSVSVGREKN